MDIQPGKYKARAVYALLGNTEKGNPQIGVEFELLDPGYEGQHITWYGYFSEKTEQRTLESLRLCGVANDEIDPDKMVGLGSTEVSLQIGYGDEYKGKTKLEVQFVNRPGGIAMKAPMGPEEKRAFAAAMRERFAATRALSVVAKPAAPMQLATKDADGRLIPF